MSVSPEMDNAIIETAVNGKKSSFTNLPVLPSKSDGVLTSQTTFENPMYDGGNTTAQGNRRSSKGAFKSFSSVVVAITGAKLRDDKAKQPTRTSLKKPKSDLNADKLNDQMNYEHLKELEKIFSDAKTDDDAGLTMDQFRVAMKKAMGEHIDDRQLDLMFMKVDNNCDGTVDWDEYLSYMLLEYQEKENMLSMAQVQPFPRPMEEKPSSHVESICRITMLQAFSTRSPDSENTSDADDAASRFLTLSKEGALNVWNLEWQVQKTMSLKGGTRSVWFTDLVCMANCNSFVVSSSEYEISFYAMTSSLIQKKFQIKGLKCCAMTLDYSFDRKNQQRSILLWGDTGGNIVIVRFYENPPLVLFANTRFPGGKCTLDALAKMNETDFKVFRINAVHGDWVQQVRYFVNNKGQECFLSCCAREESALFYADITENTKQKKCINRRTYFRITKGVLCLTYDAEWNHIVTGSRGCDVSVWNPFIVKRSLAVLKGHQASVMHILLRSSDHCVVSISKDSNIRVWDLQYYTCKQSINGKNVHLGRMYITSAYFHEKLKELIIGTNRIGIFFPNNKSSIIANRKHATSHEKAVTCVLYNRLFHQIVTAGDDSMVCIWDMGTGEKTMQFCAEKGVEITSMTFDPTWRRLVTGLRNGITVLWNFNNGACLRRMKSSDGLEISDIVFSRQRIITAGWAKVPVVYMDSYNDERSFSLKRKHGDDIMSMDYHRQESLLASAAYDGDIYIWSLDTRGVILALNMHKSLHPMHVSLKVKTNNNTINDGKRDSLQSEAPRHNSFSSTDGSGKEEQDKVKERKRRKKRKSRDHKAQQEKEEFDGNNTEINSHDAWLPSSLPWMEKKKSPNSKRVAFTGGNLGENDSDEEDEEEGEEEVNSFKIPDRAVYKIVFLQNRVNCENTATLLASNSKGWITAWSVNTRGGLLGYFQATKQDSEVVATMETDSDCRILITGDSKGYIRVWNIRGYCDGDDVKRHRIGQNPDQGREKTSKQRRSILADNYMPISLPPWLQTTFRGHIRAITSIAFIERHSLIASGSADCSIRLWTICGRYIGTFGQKMPWHIELPIEVTSLPALIPEDVKRVASKSTLRTIKGNHQTMWAQVKNAVNVFVAPEKASEVEEDASSMAKKGEQLRKIVKEGFNKVDKDMLDELMQRRGSRRKSVTVWLDDTPHAITVTKKPIDEIENSFKKLQEHGIVSSVLGKTNYKPRKRHREATLQKGITWFSQHASVYNSLPYMQLEQPQKPTLPPYVKRVQSLSNHRQSYGPITDTLHSNLVKQVAGRQWHSKTFRGKKSSSSSVSPTKNTTFSSESGQESGQNSTEHRSGGGKGFAALRSPLLTTAKRTETNKKQKHAPFALPRIAT